LITLCAGRSDVQTLMWRHGSALQLADLFRAGEECTMPQALDGGDLAHERPGVRWDSE
jgi:hypothetical protein